MRIISTLFLLVALLFGQNANQYVLFTEKDDFKFDFTYTSISLKSFPEQALYTGSYNLRLDSRVSETVSFFSEVPFFLSSLEIPNFFDGGTEDVDHEAFGNIVLGTRFLLSDNIGKKSLLELSVGLPTAKDFDFDDFYPLYFFLALYSDVLNQDKYQPNAMAIKANYIYNQKEISSNWLYSVGLRYLTNVEYSYVESELLLDYGTEYVYSSDMNPIDIGARLKGMMILTEDLEDFGDRFVHSFEPIVGFRFGQSKLAFEYRLYLKDEFDEIVDSILNINFSTTF